MKTEYIIDYRTVRPWLTWLKYTSWLGYANEALLVNQWNGVVNITCTTTNITCQTGGFTAPNNLINLGSNSTYFPASLNVGCTNPCPLTGKMILEKSEMLTVCMQLYQNFKLFKLNLFNLRKTLVEILGC